MADEFNRDPWRRTARYIDRTYPSGVARERPLLTTRIHCEPDDEVQELENRERSGNRVDLFNMQLRAGHGYRNIDDE